MSTKNAFKVVALFLALGAPFVFAPAVFAQAAEVSQVENFIKTIVQTMATIAGLIAAAFFVVGGYTYITSTGNTDKLDRAKHTMIYAALGLVIVIAAFAITNFVTSTAKGSFGG